MTSIATRRGRIGIHDIGGDTGAVPILFLHGVGSDKSVWGPQLAHFGKRRRALALDYPGYGESEPIDSATREDFAAASLAALDALSIERAHICGLSLGGIVAIAMHALAPARCASLILADSFAVHPDGQAIHDRSVAASKSMPMAELAAARAPLLLGASASEALAAEVIATMSRIDPAAYRLGASAVWLADQRTRAESIETPTLILVGDEDIITPPSLSTELGALIAGSRVETVKAAGHLSNAEQPEMFNSCVDQFLSDVERQI